MLTRITQVEDALRKEKEARVNFEKTYVLARERFSAQQEALAHGIRLNGQGIAVVDAKVGTLTTDVTALTTLLTTFVAKSEARWATADEEDGRLLAELSVLHHKDGGLEDEITEVRQRNAEQTEAIAKLEIERAGKTMRQAAVTGLATSVFAYLKANPNALENAWKWLASLLPGG